MTGVQATPPAGLAALDRVELTGPYRAVFESASALASGPGEWLGRKRSEAQSLMAMAQIAGPGRMGVQVLDLRDDLCAIFRLTVPVALAPEGSGPLRVANAALLRLMYPQIALSTPMPGFAPVSLIAPGPAWHPNIGTVHGQRLCLGATLPRGIPVSEIVLLSYALLAMQSVMLDPDDSAGVMNPEAAAWWQEPRNLELIPLTNEPFLAAGHE
jgi:hypothetical protein